MLPVQSVLMKRLAITATIFWLLTLFFPIVADYLDMQPMNDRLSFDGSRTIDRDIHIPRNASYVLSVFVSVPRSDPRRAEIIKAWSNAKIPFGLQWSFHKLNEDFSQTGATEEVTLSGVGQDISLTASPRIPFSPGTYRARIVVTNPPDGWEDVEWRVWLYLGSGLVAHNWYDLIIPLGRLIGPLFLPAAIIFSLLWFLFLLTVIWRDYRRARPS